MKKLLLFFVALVSADTVVASAAVRRVTGLVKLSRAAQAARGKVRRCSKESKKEDIAKSLTKLEIELELLRTKSEETRTAFSELQKMNIELKNLHEKTSKIRWQEVMAGVVIGTVLSDIVIMEIRQTISREALQKERIEQREFIESVKVLAREVASLKKEQEEKETQVQSEDINQKLTHFEQLIAAIRENKK